MVLRLRRGIARVIVDAGKPVAKAAVHIETPTATILAPPESALLLEVHADTSAAPSSTTYVTHLGIAGELRVEANGQTVTIGAGQGSTVLAGEPPSPPHLVKVATRAEVVARVLRDTTIKPQRRTEPARQMLLESGGVEPVAPRTMTTGKQIAQETARATTPPLIPLTPPAVISGAVTSDVGAVNAAPPTPIPSTTPTPATVPAPTPTPTPVSPSPAASPPPAPTMPPPPPPVVAAPPPPAPAPAPVVLPRPVIPRIEIDLPSDRSGPNRGRGGRD